MTAAHQSGSIFENVGKHFISVMSRGEKKEEQDEAVHV
jgi:hypothetical protein